MYNTTTLLDALNILLLQNIEPCILLIDMDEPSMDTEYNEATLQNQERLLARASQKNLHIIDIILHGSMTLDRLHSIAKQSENYLSYRKNMGSAFDEDNIKLSVNNKRMSLFDYLKSINCDHIFIMGYADDDCVFETAYDAIHLGLTVFVDRVYNLGTDISNMEPWSSVINHANLHMYTELSVPSSNKKNRRYVMYQMKLMKR